MTIRVGVDLVAVQEVESSVQRFGDRYLERVFTASELGVPGGDEHRLERLAARFAAKEAAIKTLRFAGPVDLREIEVVLAEGGAPLLRLTGEAAKFATQQRLGAFEVSLSHEGGFAIAVVVARKRLGAVPARMRRWTHGRG
jgi:holo-[acyl-carrier protein] synthase